MLPGRSRTELACPDPTRLRRRAIRSKPARLSVFRAGDGRRKLAESSGAGLAFGASSLTGRISGGASIWCSTTTSGRFPARRLTTASDEGSRQGCPDPHDRLGDGGGVRILPLRAQRRTTATAQSRACAVAVRTIVTVRGVASRDRVGDVRMIAVRQRGTQAGERIRMRPAGLFEPRIGETRISPVVARPALPSRPHRYVAATGARLAAADSGEPQATPVGAPSRSHRLWRAAVVLAGPRTLANERRAAVLEIDNQRNRSGSAVQVLLPAGQRSEPAWRVSGTRQRPGNDCISAILGRTRGLPNATSRDRPDERRTRDLPLLGCGAAVHERVLAEHLLDRPAQRLATGRSRRGSVGPRSTRRACDRRSPGRRA